MGVKRQSIAMYTSVVKKFLETRHLLDGADGTAPTKLRKHFHNIVWVTLIIVFGFVAPSVVMLKFAWWGWGIVLIYCSAATHEIYMTWRIKRLFQERGVKSSGEFFTHAA
jgi:hypothetical protein